MSISQKFKEFIAPMDEDDVLEVEQEEDTPSISEYERPKSKVNHLPTDTKMVLFEPRSFDESEEIAKRLKENKAAVVNLHKLQRDYAQRTIDFLTAEMIQRNQLLVSFHQIVYFNNHDAPSLSLSIL